MTEVHIVRAVWVHEDYTPVRAFASKEKANAFAIECEDYSARQPARDDEWATKHPAGSAYGRQYTFDVVTVMLE